jgi:DNA-binding XRE family transcriptional regulator
MGVAESLDPQSSLWAWVAFDLRRYRLMHGLSQPQVGKLIGAARQTVCNYEAGVRRIDDRQAAILDKEWDTGGTSCAS